LRLILAIVALSLAATAQSFDQQIATLTNKYAPQAIEQRQHIHRNPELGNREVKTAELIAAHLKKLGFEVRTGIAHTGVVAILKGGKPGPVIAYRADIDALPIV
jgi:metal-dependent amidase/aminoacylase/carboxypeptidase family protein